MFLHLAEYVCAGTLSAALQLYLKRLKHKTLLGMVEPMDNSVNLLFKLFLCHHTDAHRTG